MFVREPWYLALFYFVFYCPFVWPFLFMFSSSQLTATWNIHDFRYILWTSYISIFSLVGSLHYVLKVDCHGGFLFSNVLMIFNKKWLFMHTFFFMIQAHDVSNSEGSFKAYGLYFHMYISSSHVGWSHCVCLQILILWAFRVRLSLVFWT